MHYLCGVKNTYTQTVGGKTIATYENQLSESGNKLAVEFGTNGYWGKDGRTYFSLSDLGGVNLTALVDKNVFVNDSDGTIVEVRLQGDSELRLFREALSWTLQTLERLLDLQRDGEIL